MTVYGDRAFRRYVSGDGDTKGKWEPRINRALYDVQMYGFAQYPRPLITKSADLIRDASMDLMANATFGDLISHTISEKKRVTKRFQMWLHMLDGVLGDTSQGERFFPLSVKRALFGVDPTCCICKQQIRIIDDAHVDHVVPWSKGGPTTEANARLAHRLCNMARQAKDLPEATA